MAQLQGMRIFVVDDEEIISSTLATILKRSGFDAVGFTEPHLALEQAKIEAPDLLISDVMMPGMTGVELAIQLTEACPQARVLLFSGQAATANLLDEARAQGHDFQLLSKPIHPADLLLKVRAVSGD
jgi:CheY-like chemotaxis protein